MSGCHWLPILRAVTRKLARRAIAAEVWLLLIGFCRSQHREENLCDDSVRETGKGRGRSHDRV